MAIGRLVSAVMLSVFLQLIYAENATDADTPNNAEATEDMSVPQWVTNGGFLLLAVAVYSSLWGSALVCEDYFVPAMSKLCQRFDVSDDMAGATLMAIGNSAPQLFISLVSIFLTESSLGLGTAIGTVLFNHLCVCGLCVLTVKDGAIPLDWRTLCRDCVFYLLSLVLLVWVLEGSIIEAVLGLQETNQKNGEVAVHIDGAVCMVSLYVLYISVCGYYGRFLVLVGRDRPSRPSEGFCARGLKMFCPSSTHSSEWDVLNQDESLNGTPLLAHDVLGSEVGFDILSFTDDLETAALTSRRKHKEGLVMRQSSVTDTTVGGLPLRELGKSDGMQDEAVGDREEGDLCTNDFMLDASQSDNWSDKSAISGMSAAGSGGDLPHSPGPTISGQYQCWLLKRSGFYARLGISSRKWQLRFFVLDDAGFRYMRGPGQHAHVKYINIFEAASVRLPAIDQSVGGKQASDDVNMHLFYVATPEKTYVLRALSAEVQRRLFSILRRRIAIYQSFPAPLRWSMAQTQGRIDRDRNYTVDIASRGVDRHRIDFVGDTIRSREGSSDAKSAEDGGFEHNISDDEFDEESNVWDELAMYSDAVWISAARGMSSSAGARGTVVGVSRNITAAVLKGLGAFSRASGQLFRPLKWAIRRTIPSVLADDVDGEFHPDNDTLADDTEMNDNTGGGVKIRLRVNRRLRGSTLCKSVSLRLFYTIFACLLWMGFLSYFLAASCVYLGHMLGLTSAVTGLTLVSAGTSFSSLLTSLIVAYQGQGNMAVSSAFGSNVFCILFGLGFPWSMAILSRGGKPYEGLHDDGVVASAVLLLFILAGFLFVLSSTNFIMYRWLGHIMVWLYILILTYLFIFATDGLFG